MAGEVTFGSNTFKILDGSIEFKVHTSSLVPPGTFIMGSLPPLSASMTFGVPGPISMTPFIAWSGAQDLPGGGSELLERTIELLREGWTKGAYERRGEDGGLSFCMAGALRYAGNEMQLDRSAVAGVLTDKIAALFPDRCVPEVITFNDNDATTFEDVVLVAKHALEELRDREAAAAQADQPADAGH